MSILSPHLSVVVPVYECAECIVELCERLCASLALINTEYEIILVNDASPGNDWSIIVELCAINPRIRGINLSRNFGQHYAITAGLEYARGDWIVVMDCDLQYQPEEIDRLYRKALSGYDLVMGLRRFRQDSWFKRSASKFFFLVFNFFSETKSNQSLANFGIYSRQVIHNILALKEQNRSFGLFALWVGFRRAEIEINHSTRLVGRSSYSLKKMIKLASDSIVAHSNAALRMTMALGFAVAFASLLFVIWIVFSYFIWSTPIVGWSSLMVSIYLTAGMVIASLGVVGLYVGKIFDEVKRRPLYIIESTTFERNLDE
jgi:glycosyltransferase involved in cell wall biosynthesis